MAFKTDKYLKGIKRVRDGIKINCNTGAVITNKMGLFGQSNVWYIPNGIEDIARAQGALQDHLRQLGRIPQGTYAKGNNVCVCVCVSDLE